MASPGRMVNAQGAEPLPRLSGSAVDSTAYEKVASGEVAVNAPSLPLLPSRPTTPSAIAASRPKTAEMPALQTGDRDLAVGVAEPLPAASDAKVDILVLPREDEECTSKPTSARVDEPESSLQQASLTSSDQIVAAVPDAQVASTALIATPMTTVSAERKPSSPAPTNASRPTSSQRDTSMPPASAFSMQGSEAIPVPHISDQSHDARSKIEGILKEEAQQSDLLIILQRRVTGRKDPCKFLSLLQRDDKGLVRWHDNVLDRGANFEAAVVIQRKWLFGSDTVKANLILSAKLARSRALLRYELLDILELRDDVRTQAFEFFAQAAPPLAVRVRDLRSRLADVQAKALKDAADGKTAARITSTKHPAFAVLQNFQHDLMEVHTKLKAIERHMLSFATRDEMRMLKDASDDADPNALLRELLKMKKHAITPSRAGEVRKGWSEMGRWKTEERKDFLKPSAIGPERKPAKNALEEIRALRQDTQQMSDAADKLQKIRNSLASIRAGRPVQAVEDAELSRVLAQQKADAQGAMQRAVLGTLFGGKKGPSPFDPSSSLGGNTAVPGKPKGLAALARKHGLVSSGTESYPADTGPPMASLTQSPLWTYSPASGWGAHHVAARAVPRAQTPGLKRSTPAASAAGLLSLEVVPMATTAPRLQGGNLVTEAYSQAGSRWRPVRYDLPTCTWVPCARPVQLPSRTRKKDSVRPSRSLPSLMSDTYLSPQWEYRPRTPAGSSNPYVPVRPSSPLGLERAMNLASAGQPASDPYNAAGGASRQPIDVPRLPLRSISSRRAKR